MTMRPLPERANLEQLKKQAKTLLHEAQGHDPAALKRFETVFASHSISKNVFALHDAQFVI
ncbi:MAG TPA: ankyrin repeat domain-containing protein, partial [Terriglobales bacterium]